ncbi:MAG: glycosyltransferase family A protein [Microbacterium sp.]|uniref:glycosyltransferase family 2 protein n=1 Tax=Microbacterium sp. TaxID=51671 RepID=UPI0039E70E82
MPSPLRIVVVIPCRDDAPMLEACLTALAAQIRPADAVIVVDNGSSDDSAAVARRHGAEVLTEPKVGVGPAVAAGYDRAIQDAGLVARLDADSRPHPDWLARIEAAFAGDERLDVLTGGAEFYDLARFWAYLGEHWYIGGGFVWIRIWLGVPLVFGSNFAMRSAVWERARTRVKRERGDIHDDLDLTIHLDPADCVRLDRTLRMPVSGRPFATLGGLSRRVWKVARTFAASWPDGAPRRAARPREAGWDADGEAELRTRDA